MHSSLYDEALSQLHLNHQSLQENMINIVQEQARMLEMMTRIQTDLEVFKETQNDRLDDLLTNIDNDVRKVSQETNKVETAFERRISDIRSDHEEEVKRLKTEIDTLKERFESQESINVHYDHDQSEHNKEASINSAVDNSVVCVNVEEMRNDLTSFKHEMQTKLSKVVVDTSKICDHVETSAIAKLEKYIGTEVVDEIVETINGKLVLMKTEIQNDLEVHKINIDETNSKVERLKLKVAEMESTKKGFNESELFASSVDLTRTPRLQSFMRTPTRLATPIPETSCEDVDDEDEAGGRSHCSTPRSVESGQDLTLYEDVLSQRQVEVDMSGSNKNNSTSSTKCHEVEIAMEDCSSYNPVAEQFGSNYGMIPLHREDPHDSRRSSKSRRRDSLMSNIFINLTSILDV